MAVCPNCNAKEDIIRTGGHWKDRKMIGHYICKNCGVLFRFELDGYTVMKNPDWRVNAFYYLKDLYEVDSIEDLPFEVKEVNEDE